MDMSQMHLRPARHEHRRRTTGGDRRQRRLDLERRARRSAARPRLAKQTLLGLASTQLGVPVASLTVAKGVVSGGGKTVTYGQLCSATSSSTSAMRQRRALQPGRRRRRSRSATYTLVGVERRTSPADRHPGQGDRHVHVRAQRPGAGHAPRPDRPAARPGRLRRRNATNDPRRSTRARSRTSRTRRSFAADDFLGVVAPKEYDAIQAAAQLKVTCGDRPTILPGTGNLCEARCATRTRPARHPATIGAEHGQRRRGATPSAANTVSATLQVPVQRPHADRPDAARSPTCTPDGALVFANTQNAYTTATEPRDGGSRAAAATRSASATTRARASFGNAPVAYDSGLSRRRSCRSSSGAPVRLQFMRWDEHGWDNLRPAAARRHARRVDANGNIVAYEMTEFMPPGISQTADQPDAAARRAADRPLGLGALDTTNSRRRSTTSPNRRVIGRRCRELRYFKTLDDCGRRRHRRRASPRSSSSTSWPTRPRWIRTSSGSRTSRPTDQNQRGTTSLVGGGAARELAAAGGRTRSSRRATSVTGRGIGLGSLRRLAGRRSRRDR